MMSVAVVWSVESPVFQLGAALRVKFPESGILIFILGLGLCVLFCFVSGGGPAILLTADFRETLPCVFALCSGPKSVLHL